MADEAPDYSHFYTMAGAEEGIDPDLLRAQGDVESHQDRFAVSPKGAQGPMQIMPATQAELGVKDPFDPWDSIRHGAKYTKQMLDHSGGDVETALGKYNAGPNGDLSNPETVKYVRDVTDRWDNYRKQRWSRATPKASSAKPAPADTGTDAGQVPSFGELPETTPPSLTDAPDRPANAPDEAPDTGYLDAVKQGILSPLTGAAQTYRTATTGKPGESAAPRIAAAEPMTLHDLKNPRLLGEKALYEFSASFPELSAFAIGSIPGGGPTTPTGVATGSVGAALAHTVTSFGPIFGEELKASPNDPDAAFNRAYLKTGIGAVATGLGYYTFGRFNPFSNALKNLAFQTFGLQPVIGMAEHEATNVVDHKPAGQGVLEEYPGQVMGGVTTLAGFEGAKLGYHGVRAGIDALRKPVANPLLANNIGQQINAAGQAQNGQTPPTAPPEPPPAPPAAPPAPPTAPPAPPTASPTGEAPPAPPVPGAGTRTPQETLAIIAAGGDPAATPPPSAPPAPPVAPPAEKTPPVVQNPGTPPEHPPGPAAPPATSTAAANDLPPFPRGQAGESSGNLPGVQPAEGRPKQTVLPEMPGSVSAGVEGPSADKTEAAKQASGPDGQGVLSGGLPEPAGNGQPGILPGMPRGLRTEVAEEANPAEIQPTDREGEGPKQGPVSGAAGVAEEGTVRGVRGPGSGDAPPGLHPSTGRDVGVQGASPLDHAGGTQDFLNLDNIGTLRDQYGPDGLLSRAVAQMLTEGDAKPAGVARALDAKRLQQAAEMIYGGRLADNAFGRDRLYDAAETGVNRYIAMHPERFAPTGDVAHAKAAAEALAEIKNRMPTQTVRGGDKDKLQQFSTPPEYAFAAAWAANLKPTDHVLEPSAGNGGLLVHALTAGVAETTGNEISQQRLTNLRDQGFTRVTAENAEQLHNILPETIRPTAVIMNPPFSSAGDRMAGKMDTSIGAQHIEQALKRLEPGGRLVAIVGRGMSMDAPTFKPWWTKIGSQYDVRANVGVGGGIYRKYGTTFGTRVLVIDKVPPSGRAIVRNEVEGVDGLIDKLSGVRDDRPITGSDRGAGEQVAGKPTGQEVATEGAGTAEPTGTIRHPTGDLGDGGRPTGDIATAGAEPPIAPGSGGDDLQPPGDRPGGVPSGDAGSVQQPKPEPGGTTSPSEPRPGDRDDPGTSSGPGDGDHTRPDGSDVRVTPPDPEQIKAGIIVPDAEHGGELTESVYEPYHPQRVAIDGAVAHPGALVQSAAMASVLPPVPEHTLSIPKELITSGALSDAQLEAVIYAGDAHNKTLEPDEHGVVKRRGFFIGDGTGVGKGREVAGIILDNWMKGRKKAVWISEKMALANDAKRDWAGLERPKEEIFEHGKVGASADIEPKQGILFSSYDTLRAGEKVSKNAADKPLAVGDKVMVRTGTGNERIPGVLVSAPRTGGKTWTVRFESEDLTTAVPENQIALTSAVPQSRVDQIVKWVGKDFDGVIAFDEAHNMANAVSVRGKRGMTDPAAKALAGLELQNRLPNARVVYVSATGATEVTNLAYASRLGLWGRGTPFANMAAFLGEVSRGGVAAMELVSRDMKALGMYMARGLSYDGVEYDRLLHPLTSDQTVMYDKLADAWQLVLRNFEKALEDTGAKGKGGPAAGIKSAFWGGHQRFFNQLITSLQMPSVLKSVEADIKAGRQAVLQLVNTNEAGQERGLAKAKARGDDANLEELDMSPRDQLMQLVEKVFPVTQYEPYIDTSSGSPVQKVRVVVDAEGKPVINREAVAAREKLLDDLGSLRVPNGPLEILTDHFGPDVVAEVTGRKQRVVMRRDEKGVMRKVVEKRGGQANLTEAAAFQDAKKPILVFSEAGGTGRSYHAAIGSPSAGNRRAHYLIQAGWTASKAVQGFGRTHRTNQESPPIFHLVTTDLEGQKRFISSIARRLGQLGALTRGERKTGDQGMFGLKDNLESEEAKAALTQLYRDAYYDRIPGINEETFSGQMGLSLTDPTTGGLRQDLPPMTQFLNRLLSLRSTDQNRMFQAFSERFDGIIERATQNGTLDTGTETYRADSITKKSQQVVYTEPATSAETHHIHLETHTRNNPRSFDEVNSGNSFHTAMQRPLFYMQNMRSKRIVAISPSNYSLVGADGKVTDHYRSSNPLKSVFVKKEDIDYADSKKLRRVFNLDEAKAIWDAQVAEIPEFRTEALHMITGAILPIWDRLGGQPKIYRLQTDNGERILGRVVDNQAIKDTLKRLGASSEKITASPAEMAETILKGGHATLANGWTIQRSMVAGQWRLELRGVDYASQAQLLADGVFSERINYDTRLFIPSGPDGAAVLERITKTRPVTDLDEPGSARDASAGREEGDDDSQYARRGRKPDVAQTAAPSTEDRTADHPELHTAMSQMLRFVGIPETVGLKFLDRIPKGGPDGADAVYDKGLITYALDTTAGHAPTKIWHEAIHALMDPALGLLNESHRRALLTGADRWMHDGKRGVDRRAELKALGYTDAQMREEAVARMGEEALARGLEPKSLLGGAIIRMRNFARGLGQVFRGQGWTTAEDVFNGLMRGDRALPKAKEAMRASASAPPRPQAPEPEDGGEKPAARTFDEAFPPEDTQSLSDVLTAQRDEKFAARRSPLQVGRDAADDIARMFSPTSRGPDAKQTELTIRGRGAKLAQSSAQAGHALEQWRHVVGRLPEAEQYEITDRMERGLPMTDPALQPVARTIRAELDRVTRAIQSLPGNRLAQAKVDYMGRIYANYPEWSAGQQTGAQAQANGLSAAIGAGVSKRPLPGNANFLKQRSFDFLSDARQAGLVPVTSNPLEMQTLKLREMWKFYHGMKLAEELKAQGIARWVKQSAMGAARSAGLAELNDRIFNPKVPVPGGLTEYGKWMAPEAAARLFNNYVSEGLRGNTLYDMTRSLGNALNSLQLGLSAFHATFIGLDTMTSRVARGLDNFAHGEFGRGIINTALGFSPHNVARSIARGSKLKAAYLDPMNADPQWKKLADLLNAGGGRISMDQFYRSNVSGSFFKNMNDMKNPGGVWREARIMAKDSPLTLPLDMAGRIIETSMEPIMGQMVPRAKLGVFADMAEDWQRRNPLATPEETAAAMTKAWDSVDNRMGQLVYDNLFWPKITKDLAFISTRSVGWNLGTIRELGGGVVDTARAINAAAHLRAPEFTARMAYTLAMPLLTGMMGAVLTYAYTGAAPTSLLDYFYPPNGKPDGGRVSIPGYIKDVVAYLHAPVQTLLNKTHPLMSMASQLYHNRDYRSGSIYDAQRDNSATVQYANYLLNTTMPFTVQAMRKNAADGASGMDQALAFFGVQPAPASIIHPEKQEKHQRKDDAAAYRARMKENLWRPLGGN